MATQSGILTWKIPWMEEPGGLQSMGSLRVMTERLRFHFSLSCIGEGNGNHSSVLAWRIPGTEEPGRLPSLGSHKVGHNSSDLAAAAALLMMSSIFSYTHWSFVYLLWINIYSVFFPHVKIGLLIFLLLFIRSQY